jgi:uncharacterized protein YjiS (DUF1127 family)
MLITLFEYIRRRLLAHRTRRALERLDDRMLADIGMVPALRKANARDNAHLAVARHAALRGHELR